MKKQLASFFRLIASILAYSDNIFIWLFSSERLILCYHNVSSDPSAFEIKYQLNHSPEAFREQVEFFSKFFTFGHPKKLITEGKAREVFFSFDDGLKGSLTEGISILREFNAASMHFLNMGVILKESPYWVSFADYYEKEGLRNASTNKNIFLERPWDNWFLDTTYQDQINDYTPTLASLEEIKKADNDELVFFGNHLFDHYNAVEIDSEELKEQYNLNRKSLLNLKSFLNYFAYPFGQPDICYNNDTTKLIFNLGSDAVFTANANKNKLDEKKYFYRYSLSPDIRGNYNIKRDLIYQKIRSILLKLL